MTTRTVWIGSYPPAGIGTPSGHGEGIYRVRLDLRTGELSEPRRWVETPAPSFVVPGPGGTVLYATDEDEAGRVAAFRVHDDGLEPLGTASSGGSYPCHLAVHDHRLAVANYGDGALGVLDLAEDATITIDGRRFPIQISAGIATAPEDGATRQEILAVADTRMYESKSARRWILAGASG